jgi:hypothetical protein
MTWTVTADAVMPTPSRPSVVQPPADWGAEPQLAGAHSSPDGFTPGRLPKPQVAGMNSRTYRSALAQPPGAATCSLPLRPPAGTCDTSCAALVAPSPRPELAGAGSARTALACVAPAYMSDGMIVPWTFSWPSDPGRDDLCLLISLLR